MQNFIAEITDWIKGGTSACEIKETHFVLKM